MCTVSRSGFGHVLGPDDSPGLPSLHRCRAKSRGVCQALHPTTRVQVCVACRHHGLPLSDRKLQNKDTSDHTGRQRARAGMRSLSPLVALVAQPVAAAVAEPLALTDSRADRIAVTHAHICSEVHAHRPADRFTGTDSHHALRLAHRALCCGRRCRSICCSARASHRRGYRCSHQTARARAHVVFRRR